MAGPGNVARRKDPPMPAPTLEALEAAIDTIAERLTRSDPKGLALASGLTSPAAMSAIAQVVSADAASLSALLAYRARRSVDAGPVVKVGPGKTFNRETGETIETIGGAK